MGSEARSRVCLGIGDRPTPDSLGSGASTAGRDLAMHPCCVVFRNQGLPCRLQRCVPIHQRPMPDRSLQALRWVERLVSIAWLAEWLTRIRSGHPGTSAWFNISTRAGSHSGIQFLQTHAHRAQKRVQSLSSKLALECSCHSRLICIKEVDARSCLSRLPFMPGL